jgi:hypothetical protein
MTNVYDPKLPLNLTTTQPPQADNVTKIVTLNFDGTFFDTAKGTNHVKKNINPPHRISGLNSNQIFIHQTTIASLLIGVMEEFMPYEIKDGNVTSEILQLFPEIGDYYGESITTDLLVNVYAPSGEFLSINQ